MVKLGQTVRDRITGFRGVVTGRCEYITGCTQILVVPRVDDKGATVAAAWHDEQRCEIDTHVPVVTLDNGETPGCDLSAPIR